MLMTRWLALPLVLLLSLFGVACAGDEAGLEEEGIGEEEVLEEEGIGEEEEVLEEEEGIGEE
jgi:hypothetical protein